ncbi:MAG: dihydrolipoamide acetyltransferase family protein [Pseudomonadota bacterium]
MIKEIVVPKLGMSQGQVTVVEWVKADGQPARQDETVVVIETAKVTYEIAAPADGLVFSLVKVKSKAAIGEILGVVADSVGEFQEYAAGRGRPVQAPAPSGGLFDDADEIVGPGLDLVIGPDRDAAFGADRREPSTAAWGPPVPPPLARVDLTDRRIKTRRPFTGMRKTIAENLMYSLHSSAQLTVFAQADLTELGRLRDEFRLDRPEAKITFLDLLVKLLPSALAEQPVLNSALVEDEIIYWDEFHIGVAVALDQGLVVPVVRDVDKKGLFAVSREIKKLAGRARTGELTPEDYQGGTFTISSGGPVEVEFMTPIINPPQNAILGLGKIGPKPALVDGVVTVRTMTYLCLTHDHRVVDGVPAAMFLGGFKKLIETPALFRKILR